MSSIKLLFRFCLVRLVLAIHSSTRPILARVSKMSCAVGQGGLALLAEHLPLLYPEITQSNRTSSSTPQTAGDLSDQDYEFVTQVKGISLGPLQVII